LAQLANALVGGLGVRRANEQEEAGRSAANKTLAQALASGPNASIEALTTAASNPWTSENQQRLISTLLGEKLADENRLDERTYKEGIRKEDMTREDRIRAEEIAREEAMFGRKLSAPVAINDQLVNPVTGEVIGNYGIPKEVKAPTVKSFYDDQGNEYKAQFNPSTGEWDRVGGTKAPTGMQIRTNPDGTFEMVQGPGKLTEAQSKDAVYSTRAKGALEVLDPLAKELTDPMARMAENDPTGVVRGRAQSPDYQKARQAGLEFLQAILRKDTGAAITSQEQDEYGRVYLPMPGDSPEVQQQKKVSRLRAVAALEAGMAPQALLNMEKALLEVEGAMETPPPEADNTGRRKTKSGVTYGIIE
jgi:hypothetical protein